MISIHSRLAAILLLLVCLCSYSSLWAAPVSPEQVRQAADTFLKVRQARSSRTSPWLAVPPKSRAVGEANDVSPRTIRDTDGTILAYVIELEPEGFVVTSADTDITPIVAYSFRSAFPDQIDGRHPLYCLLTADMRLRIAAPDQSDPSTTAQHNAQWHFYSAPRASMAQGQPFQQWPPVGSTSTGGWLETTWEQGTPYNAFCPLDPVDGVRSYVGCVATAMAQVLHYHRQGDAVFTADDTYTTTNGIDIDGDCIRYDFPSLAKINEFLLFVQLKYDAQIELDDADIAALNFACGVAAKMDFSSEGSGASAYDMRDGMVEKFGFRSADLTGDLSQQTVDVLRENLANRLPAILGIHTPDGMAGHAIVCDGYNTDGEYHLNFGWGRPYPDPIAEAWYHLPVDIPFSLNAISAILLNIQPAAPDMEVSPSSLRFRGIPGQVSEPLVLSLRNSAGRALTIDSIKSPEGFVISRTGDNYSDHISAFAIADSGQDSAIHVRFNPETAGAYYGMLTIHYGDGLVKRVPLDGAATAGGTEIEAGTVSGTWSQAQSPYYVFGDITVAEGSELIVEPGTRVVFMGPYRLIVARSARLLAQGTADRPVEFTAGHRESGWAGIRFLVTGDDDVLSYCSITYAKNEADMFDPSDPLAILTADQAGGAVYCYGSSPTITHCQIANNTCGRAGAIYCLRSSAVIRNTLIANNTCIGGNAQSGGISCVDGAVRIDNCTIVNNAPGGIFSESEYGAQVTNTIVWGNSTYQIMSYESQVAVSSCDVQGGYEGQGNIDSYPCFFKSSDGPGSDHDASTANWALQICSPCINAGAEGASGTTDLIGNPRVHSGLVDIGAYENQLDLPVMGIRPASIVEFGCVAVDANAITTVKIANTGGVDFQVSSLSISDARGVFSILNPVGKHPLSPGQSIEVEIGFAPEAERDYSGILHIVSTSSNAPYRRLVLRGTGGLGTLVPGGPVSGVWTKAGSPYTVTGDIEVPAGQTLSIEPGVTVTFAGHFGLTVGRDATLHAVGVEHDPILFTAIDTVDGWFGIRFVHAGDDDVLLHCHFQYANKPFAAASDMADLVGGAVLCCKAHSLINGSAMPGPASSPTIDHCVFSDNHAESGGAIACVDDSQATITNNTIVENTADWDGGGICLSGADPVITNNVIAENSAYSGGGICNGSSNPLVANNTIVRNRPSGLHLWTGLAFRLSSSRGQACIVNNIIWENEIYCEENVLRGPVSYDIRFNDIQGSWDGEGNIEVDPLFVDSARGDFHLKSAAGRWDTQAGQWVFDDVTSPCIDAADPSSGTAEEPAPHGGRINMGAYGGTVQASRSP